MFYEMNYCIKNGDRKGLRNCLKSILPPRFVSNVVFRKHHHRNIDYKSPLLLDEKLLILKDGLYRKNELVTSCTDKYAVREYVRSKGLEGILTPLIGVYRSSKNIPWDKLPNKFAIKCNHGSGYNVIVTDKSNENFIVIKKKLDTWMKQDYATISAEAHYRDIPHKIIIEEYIETKAGKFPVDYKFFASRGQVICLLMIMGRGKSDKARIYLDKNFEDIKLVNEYSGNNYKKWKPRNFQKMVQIAEKLSADFPFVRVDLYDRDGDILFGELTFTPHGCCHSYMDEKAQEWIGKQIIL